MKKLIVIGCYPNTPKKEEVLKLEIKSLQNLGFDFMLVSHYPVSPDIQSMVNYYIYDKNQILTPLDKTTYYWFKTDLFLARVNNSRHALPICQNMFNAFKFAEVNNYDFVLFTENDNIFSKTDSLRLSSLINETLSHNKIGLFFKPHNYRDNGSEVYETQMFGINPKRFNEIFKLPITGEEYFTHPEYPVSLELAFYQSLNFYESEFLIIETHSHEYFSDSRINIFRVEGLIIELVKNNLTPNLPVLFCHQNNDTSFNYSLKIKVNGNITDDNIHLHPGFWFYKYYSINEDLLEVEIYRNGVLDETKSYNLNDSIYEYINQSGIIEFN